MSTVNLPRNNSFDYLQQNITFLGADGVTPFAVGMADIQDWYTYNNQMSINYGAQAGMCLIMFIILAVLTRASKRCTPVFILNVLSLILGFIRALLLALYATSPWNNFYLHFTYDITGLPATAYSTSVTATVIPVLMTITVNLSLVLQAYVVCEAMERYWVCIISIVSVMVFLLASGFRLAQCIANSMTIVGNQFAFNQYWIRQGQLATETAAILFFSCIFTGKLLWTIYARRALGFQSWSYMQVLAAMGGCTMIIPSIFVVLENTSVANDFPAVGTLSLTIVALLLPLSSLWASMVTTEASSTFNTTQLWATSLNSHSSNEDSEFSQKKFGSSTSHPSAVDFLHQTHRQDSTASISPTTIDVHVEPYTPLRRERRDSTEMDLEKMGVRVERSYTIRSGKQA